MAVNTEMVAALRQFWNERYTAGNLLLSVLDSEFLDTLQALVDQCSSLRKDLRLDGRAEPLVRVQHLRAR